jgi:hypothetical protein
MNAAANANVIRYKRPPRKFAGAGRRSGYALRLEGSLAADTALAPIIPIFPALALAAEHRAMAEFSEFHPVPA